MRERTTRDAHAPGRRGSTPPSRVAASRRARLPRAQARAQRSLPALEHALIDLGLPETLAAAVEWPLRPLGQLLGTIVAGLFPTRFGGQTADALTRGRLWAKPLPGTRRGAWPTPQGGRQWPRRGQALLAPRWPPREAKSPATRRRWPWTGIGEARVVKPSGQLVGRGGRWGRGPEPRGRRGIEGVRLVAVRGAGKLVIPVAFTGRRPDPVGPGRPGRDPLTGWRVMGARTWAAWPRRRRRRPVPLVGADRWGGDAKVRAPVALPPHGTWLGEGQRPEVFHRPAGRRGTGQALRHRTDWPWRDSAPLRGTREVRLTATSPTDGRVTGGMVDPRRRERSAWRCQATASAAPRRIRAWTRRSGMAPHGRVRTPLWATEAGQVHEDAADHGHLVWRRLAGMVVLSTARMLRKGQVTRAALGFRRQHHGRFLTSQALEFHALSWDISLEAA